jgi:haloalkane dehalogenase
MSQPAAPRPAWVPDALFPFESHFAEIDGSTVHYIYEGNRPPLLMLHGNPTWSFLYREPIKSLRDRYRCIAPDHPGFGLSRAPSRYGYTPAEHTAVLEQLIERLDLSNVTMMVQDWGGPIGFAAATRHPERFSAFVIGNTWAWPKSDPVTQVASCLLGGPLGSYLILQRNFFVEKILPGNVKRRKLMQEVMDAYRGPFPTPESRRPMHVFPREILHSRRFLADRAAAPQAQRPPRATRLANQGHRLPRARAQTVGTALLQPSHRHPRRCRPLHRGGRARRDRERDRILEPSGLTRRLIAQLEALGQKVTLQPIAT